MAQRSLEWLVILTCDSASSITACELFFLFLFFIILHISIDICAELDCHTMKNDKGDYWEKKRVTVKWMEDAFFCPAEPPGCTSWLLLWETRLSHITHYLVRLQTPKCTCLDCCLLGPIWKTWDFSLYTTSACWSCRDAPYTLGGFIGDAESMNAAGVVLESWTLWTWQENVWSKFW